MNSDYLNFVYGVTLTDPRKVVCMVYDDVVIEKPLVIYHANCADGFSAAWCFHYYSRLVTKTNWDTARHGHAFDFHPGIYQESPPDVTGKIVYMVDFSYKKEVVKEMCAKAKHVYLIDHHKSAIEDIAPLLDPNSGEWINNFGAYIDLNRSGAMLAWDFLFNKGDLGTDLTPGDITYAQPPILLEHVQDRDLWKFKLDGTRSIQAAMTAREYTFANWDVMMLGGMQLKMELWKEGGAIERKYFKDIADILKLCKRTMWIDGCEVPVCNMPGSMASDAGAIMCEDETIPFSASYYDTKTQRIFSLRSKKGGVDVSLIALKYGGGGHENAAGFKVSREHILAST